MQLNERIGEGGKRQSEQQDLKRATKSWSGLS